MFNSIVQGWINYYGRFYLYRFKMRRATLTCGFME